MSCLRERDELCFRLCKMQARLFERASRERIPSHFFLRAYLASPYVRDMDDLTIFDGVVGEEEIFQSIKSRIKTTRGTVYDAATMSWVGYLLREWAYRYKTYTTIIAQQVDLAYLASVYGAYHSLDVLKAIEKIASEKGIDLAETPEERLRKILLKPQK